MRVVVFYSVCDLFQDSVDIRPPLLLLGFNS